MSTVRVRPGTLPESPVDQRFTGLFLFNHLKFDTDLILLYSSFDFCAISAVFSPLKNFFSLKVHNSLKGKEYY